MYGLNGNHLNWDEVAYWDEVCIDCEEAIREETARLLAMRDNGEIDGETFEERLEEVKEEIYFHCGDGNHTHEYEITTVLGKGKIVHDTNNNFIWVSGILPVNAFNVAGMEYLSEYHEDDFEYLHYKEGFLKFKRTI